MTTHTFTLTVEANPEFGADHVRFLVQEFLDDGYSFAWQLSGDEEASFDARGTADQQLSLDLRLTPGNARADAIMRLLVDERDSWLQAVRSLEDICLTSPGTKEIAALLAGIHHANTMRAFMVRLIADLEQLP